MKRMLLLLMVSIVFIMSSCTENQRAKGWGGTATVDVPPGNKVTNITWKGDQLWYSYRPFSKDEEPQTQIFVEQSSWGVMEGKVVFVESK